MLLYPDGLPEARRPDGALSAERLGEVIEHQASSAQLAPESARVRAASVERARRDDATALLIEWRRESRWTLLPDLARGRG
jgi:serine phosphatase RsbU (regulator of sigma subunit)